MYLCVRCHSRLHRCLTTGRRGQWRHYITHMCVCVGVTDTFITTYMHMYLVQPFLLRNITQDKCLLADSHIRKVTSTIYGHLLELRVKFFDLSIHEFILQIGMFVFSNGIYLDF